MEKRVTELEMELKPAKSNEGPSVVSAHYPRRNLGTSTRRVII